MSADQQRDDGEVALAAGVTKTVVTAGHGDSRPPQFAKCFVHFKCFVRGEEVHDTTVQDGSPVEVMAGGGSGPPSTSTVTRGLEIGLLGMVEGEKATLCVSSEYGYGEEGSFSFPSVPPSSDLVYTVHLFGWLEPGQEKPRGDMLFEERLCAAQRRRDLGVEKFRAGAYEDSWTYFSMGLSYLNQDLMLQLEDKEARKANEVRHPLLLNSFSSLVRLQRHGRALEMAERVVREDPGNAKAWCRVAKGHRLQGDLESAIKAIGAASRLEPESAAVRDESRRIEEATEAKRGREKGRFFGMFG